MKARGLVLEGKAFRAPLGAVAPPLSLPDVSRFGNNGTFTDVTWVQLPSGLWVMSFNGTSSSVNCGNHQSLNQTNIKAIEVWAKTLAIAVAVYTIYTKGEYLVAAPCVALFLDTDKPTLQYSNGAANRHRPTSTAITIGIWAHIAGIINPDGSINMYLNGALDQGAEAGIITSPTDSAVNAYIGANVGGIAEFYYEGSITLLRLYTYALEAATINKHFEAERRFFGV